MMTLDESLLTEAKEVRERLLDLQHDVERARVDYQHAIRRLHAAGGSMREIAEVLGLSHQRVHQIVDAGPEDARVGRRHAARRVHGRFARFTRYARAAVENAQREAEELGHGYLGTEHLLLGLLGVERGGAAVALESLGVSHETLRQQVQDAVGESGTVRRRGRMPLTAKLKHALELAVAAAQERSARWVGTEHLLLGLAAEHEGLAAELLAAAGADEARVREAVDRVLGR
jgi:DNA-binding MarR family transcriptional regulator